MAGKVNKWWHCYRICGEVTVCVKPLVWNKYLSTCYKIRSRIKSFVMLQNGNILLHKSLFSCKRLFFNLYDMSLRWKQRGIICLKDKHKWYFTLIVLIQSELASSFTTLHYSYYLLSSIDKLASYLFYIEVDLKWTNHKLACTRIQNLTQF